MHVILKMVGVFNQKSFHHQLLVIVFKPYPSGDVGNNPSKHVRWKTRLYTCVLVGFLSIQWKQALKLTLKCCYLYRRMWYSRSYIYVYIPLTLVLVSGKMRPMNKYMTLWFRTSPDIVFMLFWLYYLQS